MLIIMLMMMVFLGSQNRYHFFCFVVRGTADPILIIKNPLDVFIDPLLTSPSAHVLFLGGELLDLWAVTFDCTLVCDTGPNPFAHFRGHPIPFVGDRVQQILRRELLNPIIHHVKLGGELAWTFLIWAGLL